MAEYTYWNRDYSKLVPLNSDLEFEADMAGMRAIGNAILNIDAIRDAVADDISKDDDQ